MDFLAAFIDVERFEREFAEKRKQSALVEWPLVQWTNTVERFRAAVVVTSSKPKWSDRLDPMEVTHALESMCASGMRETSVATYFERSEAWVKMMLRLGNLIPELKGMLGPQVPSMWRLSLHDAGRISQYEPDRQISQARFGLRTRWR